jgi:hypothetical protein
MRVLTYFLNSSASISLRVRTNWVICDWLHSLYPWSPSSVARAPGQKVQETLHEWTRRAQYPSGNQRICRWTAEQRQINGNQVIEKEDVRRDANADDDPGTNFALFAWLHLFLPPFQISLVSRHSPQHRFALRSGVRILLTLVVSAKLIGLGQGSDQEVLTTTNAYG